MPPSRKVVRNTTAIVVVDNVIYPIGRYFFWLLQPPRCSNSFDSSPGYNDYFWTGPKLVYSANAPDVFVTTEGMYDLEIFSVQDVCK